MTVLKLKLGSTYLLRCGYLLVLVAAYHAAPVYANPELMLSLVRCQHDSNLMDDPDDEKQGMGLQLAASVSENWFIDIEGCILSTRNPKWGIDKSGYEDVYIASNGGLWGSFGVGRRFFEMIFLQSGVYYLEDQTSYSLANYDDEGQRTDYKDLNVKRPLLGIGSSFGLTYPADSKFSIFASIGVVQYFYNFERSKMDYQFYRTSNIGLSISR